MLTRSQKEELVNRITDEIKDSTTLVLCDYKGLTVAELREVRNMLREKQAKMEVAKKTLIKLALQKMGVALDVTKLDGQVALIWGGEDEITTPKVVAEYARKNDKLKMAAGVLELKVLTAAEMINLAKLPGKQEMLAKLVGTINAPISGFVQALAGNIRNLVTALGAIKDTKSD